jgi:hypothetical protein
MSPRALVASVLLLSAGLMLAFVMLATLSAESDQSMIQQPSESLAGKTRESPTAGPCEETMSETEVAEAGGALDFRGAETMFVGRHDPRP